MNALDPAKGQFVPALTGVRGIAALWVMGVHFPMLWMALHPGTIVVMPGIIGSGYLGVDLFFILSGFILSYVYSSKIIEKPVAGSKDFYTGRLYRIWPLNGIVLIVLAVFIWLTGLWGAGQSNTKSLILSFLLIQHWVYHRPDIWNFPAWSLSVEAMAYVIFPLIVWAIHVCKDVRTRILLIALNLAVLFAYVVIVKHNADGLNIGGAGAPVRCITEFFSGALLFSILRDRPIGRRQLLGFDLASIALFLLALAPKMAILAPVAFLGILVSCAKGGRVGKFMETPVVKFLGDISFSLYITHWVTLFMISVIARGLVSPTWPEALRVSIFALSIPAVFVVAVLTWQFVEKPSHKLAKLMRRRISAKQVASDAAIA